MGGNHNLYCSGNQPDIVERLRFWGAGQEVVEEAADEITRLRDELASCIEDLDREVRVGNDYMEQLAECERESETLARQYHSMKCSREDLHYKLATVTKDAERYRWIRDELAVPMDDDGWDLRWGCDCHTDEVSFDAAIDAAMKGGK